MPSFGDFGVCTSSKFLCPDPPCFESHSTAPHVANKFQLHFLLGSSSFNSWTVHATKIYVQLTLEQDHYNHYYGDKGIYPPWTNIAPQIDMLGILVSFLEGLFSWARLLGSGRVMVHHPALKSSNCFRRTSWARHVSSQLKRVLLELGESMDIGDIPKHSKVIVSVKETGFNKTMKDLEELAHRIQRSYSKVNYP